MIIMVLGAPDVQNHPSRSQKVEVKRSLERFSFNWIHTGIGEAVAVFLGPDGFNDAVNGGSESIEGPFGAFTQESFGHRIP